MHIGPLDADWSDPDATQSAIAAWEAEVGLRLPEDYRRFLARFDGGYPYPNLFDAEIIRAGIVVSSSPQMMAEFFYSFAELQAHWRGETYGAGTPPQMAFIGCEPGGVEILMSLRDEDRGAIYLWSHSTNLWGSDGNDPRALIRQAESFGAFLASLYDSPEAEGFAHWNTPNRRAQAQSLTLPL